ncbi:MAG: sulfite exporter TauE/SafE family protein [Gammaproteobacteria bacterium]|nr:sulfite exporter TauE/SafE family protein [Gammaproteobacteria bacterium]
MLLALLGAILIGLSLGLLGSGGSILTVPVLVYLLDQPEKVAIAGSLAIVGAIAAVGSLPYARQQQVDWRSVLWFGLPGMLGTWLGALASQFVSGAMQLGLFAIVMLLAAVLMARPPRLEPQQAPARAAWKIVIDGLAVGLLTGLVGVGGGFLIVPALVLMGGLTMRVAVGTSLVIIALKSATGLIGYLQLLSAAALDWTLLGLFIALGVAGSLAGNALANRVPQRALRRIFAVFLVVMAAVILWRTLPAMFS